MKPLPHTRTELAGFIDHTLLRPEATAADVDRLCDECLKYGFHAACVNPIWVARCAERLTGGGVVVVSVAGFPLGAGTPEAKAYEALVGVDAGAGEIDMVANLGALRASDVAHVTHDIEAVVETVKTTGTPITLKVILETRILTNEQIILGCRCAAAAGADFVKTSTGFHLAGGDHGTCHVAATARSPAEGESFGWHPRPADRQGDDRGRRGPSGNHCQRRDYRGPAGVNGCARGPAPSHCPQCGQPASPRGGRPPRFCAVCGQRLTPLHEEVSDALSPRRRPAEPLRVVGLVVVAAVAWLLFGRC